jgi:hypothetical protein
MRRAVLALCLLFPLAVVGEEDEAWRAARWGMTPAALDAAVPGLVTLDPPWRYGGDLTAPRALRETRLAGLAMRALFQTDADGRLAQILLDRRRPVLRAGDGARALAALRARHGPETRFCLDRARPGGPVAAAAFWRTETARVTLTWLDFGTGEGLDQVAEARRRALLREGEVKAARELERRSPPPGGLVSGLPRRLLVRLSDPDRPGGAPCPPRPAPRPPRGRARRPARVSRPRGSRR